MKIDDFYSFRKVIDVGDLAVIQSDLGESDVASDVRHDQKKVFIIGGQLTFLGLIEICWNRLLQG